MRPHHPIDDALLTRLPTKEGSGPDEGKKPSAAKVKLDETGAVPDILEVLATLEERDARVEKMAPVLNGLGVITLFGGIIVGFVVPNVPLGIVLAIRGVLGMVGGAAFRSEDVSDRQLTVICTVLSTFASELRPGRPVRLHADFTGLVKTRGIKDGARKTYRHPWLRLELPLADGTTVRIQASASMKRKSKRKRKYTKHKDQVSRELTIELLPPTGKQLCKTHRPKRPQIDGFSLTRAQMKPRQAIFSFRSQPPLRRARGRGGWSLSSPGHLVDGAKVVAAIIQSYKATATASREAAA